MPLPLYRSDLYEVRKKITADASGGMLNNLSGTS